MQLLRQASRAALLTLAAGAAASALAAGPQKGRIPGFLDARSGQFVAQVTPAVAGDIDPAAVGVYGGTLALRINITARTGVPAAWTIHCAQYVTVMDPTGLTITNAKLVKATRTGTTATCSPNINYSWAINNTNAIVAVQYAVFTEGDSSVLEEVQVNGGMPTIAVPPNGQTTSRTVDVTL